MSRLPVSEIEQLKLTVSLERLVESCGVVLKPHGKDRIGHCPFHDDKTPSLVVSPKANLWHCLGACQAGGSVIDWVMRFEGVSFRHALELLRNDYAPGNAAAPAKQSTVPKLAAPVAFDADDRGLLMQMIDYYHDTLKRSPEALEYLRSRGIEHPEAIEHFKLGYANRTLGLRLPDKNRLAGADIRTRLQKLGILRESGHEHFNGSLVIPVIVPNGDVTEVYGRKLNDNLRAGTSKHLYLPGPHRGVWNEQALIDAKEVILCEALIDALTFWCAGYRNVIASYGINGFTAEHLAALREHGTERVLIAYDRDAAGDAAAEKLAERLIAAGMDCYRIGFPHGMDANDYALQVQPASASLGVAIRGAAWIGNGAAKPITTAAALPVHAADAIAEAKTKAVLQEEKKRDAVAAAMPLDDPPLAASPLPQAAPPVPVTIENEALRVILGDRTYRVRGIEKNPSYEQLKVWIKVQRESPSTGSGQGFVHIDTVELYTARARTAWIKQASIELGLSEDAAKADLAALLRVIELRQDELIRARQTPHADAAAAPLPPEREQAALALLRDPHLLERIAADVAAIGVVGEDANALTAYLACVSRKLDKPLAILIQSTSAAGKSTLMDALLSLMPEAERVHYSAMTGQALFYLGEGDLKHKILGIAEEEGVRQAAYALKLLQSQGELTIASTGKDPATGKLITEEYRVEGPVMLFLTTTAIDLDEELLNRCLVLTINESRAQTQAIHQRQREARTLAGLLAGKQAEAIRSLHRDAQSLLRPIAVVNPYANALTFRSETPRLRRDHAKYLTLIDAIALLQQRQREVKRAGALEYIEVTVDDIALANRLAADVLGRSLDELPPQTRGVLNDVVNLVAQRERAQHLPRSQVRFTRRELREATGRGDTQLKLHLGRLEDHEYLIVHRGVRHHYELVFDGELASAARQAIGLLDVATLTTADRSGQTASRSAPGRGVVGPRSGHGREAETPRNAHADAECSSLGAAKEQITHSGTRAAAPSYRKGGNGAALAASV